MGDDYRTNGGSIIVQMGDGAKPQSSPICTIIIPHSPVDGHSLLPGRSLALVVLIITQMGDRHEVAAPVDGHSIIVQMGDGAKPLPRRWPQPTTRAIPRPGSLIITQLRDRHEVAAPVNGRSIIVQMGDGAKPLPPSMAIAYYQGDPSPW